MNYEYIEQLIARYFDANTTQAEEAILRTFFGSGEVPDALRRYAPLFAYTAEQSKEAVLDNDFDQRVLARVQSETTPKARTVKIIEMTWGERLRPLWRATAAVAIVVVLVGAIQQTAVQTSNNAVFLSPGGEARQEIVIPENTISSPLQQAQEHLKMAITQDTLQGLSRQ